MTNENYITTEKAFDIFAAIRHRDYYVTTEVAWDMFRLRNENEHYSIKELREAALERWKTSYERERHYRQWNASAILRREVYPGQRDMTNQRARMIEKLKRESQGDKNETNE